MGGLVLARRERPGQVLIISHDVVGSEMAGPGIRYFHLAHTLAREFQTVLAVPAECTLELPQSFRMISYHPGEQDALEHAIQRASAVLIPAVWLTQVPCLLDSSVPLVIDGYDPFLAETLFLRRDGVNILQYALAQAYLTGDFFICASERQRDWWLGLLEAHGRINSHSIEDDPSLRRLIDVVPFGLPSSPLPDEPVEEGPVGIESGDRVLLWGGGLWDWLDPLTAIRAMPKVLARMPKVKLLFPGTRHPNPAIPSMCKVVDAKGLARDLGLLGRQVLFGEWVPWEEWVGYLQRADVGLSLHPDTVEARLAFRTRILDYVWAGLPMVVTRGDVTSELVERYKLGVVVDYSHADQVAEAILQLLDTSKTAFQKAFERARTALTWEKAAQPLVEFCRHPRRAPDKQALGQKLGNAFYLEEIARLRRLVEGYEQGRFMRFMRRVHEWRRKVSEKK